jgi:hypothetical protein
MVEPSAAKRQSGKAAKRQSKKGGTTETKTAVEGNGVGGVRDDKSRVTR